MRVPALPAAVVAVVAAACGDPAARVSLVPVGAGPCGAPASATGLKVIAYGATGEVTRAVAIDQTVTVGDFPADTQAIGVEVLGAGGANVAIGRTAPLAFDALPDGATIPIFMAPPDGTCALPDLGAGRQDPLVALAGDGVLIAGGRDASGPLSSAERYDPATGTFSPVAIPEALVDPDNGLLGGVLTSLPDGRVALTGTASHVFVLYDPRTHAFGTPVVTDRRAFHAALALDADHLLVTGGCGAVVAGACSGATLHSTLSYAIADLAQVSGAVLGGGDPRTGGALMDLGPRASDGARAFAYASGEPEPGRLARFAFADANADELDGLPAELAALDGGGLLAAFGSDGGAPSDAAVIVAPGASAPTTIARPPSAAAGARLVTLEDGRVLAVGGVADGSVALYDPTRDAWAAHVPAGDAPGALAAPTLVRLPDGSVLVVGAPGGPGAPSHAWRYRPSLVGPASGLVLALPDGSTDGVLTPSDPARVTRAADALTLHAPAAADPTLPARALIGGPRTATGALEALVAVRAGGVALIGQQVGPGRALVAELVPGAPVAIARRDAALASGGASCTGPVVAPFSARTTLRIDVHAGLVTVSRDGAAIATCALDGDPDGADAGAWGVAAAGAGGVIDVLTVTATR